jgi:hypothetical protein
LCWKIQAAVLAQLGADHDTAIWEQTPDMLQGGEKSPDEFAAKQSVWISKQMQRCV